MRSWLALLGLLSAAPALAQVTVEPIQGGVLVARNGGGFQRVTQPVQLAPGDRVAVSQGSRAQIDYGNGCSVTVVPGAVQIIAAAPPCVAGGPPGTGPFGGTIAGAPAGAVVGGLLVVGTGAAFGAAIATSGNGVTPPRSP